MRTHNRLIVGMVILALLLASVPVAGAQDKAPIGIGACQQILVSGDYILTANIATGGTDPCIEILEDNVQLDGGGFTITIDDPDDVAIAVIHGGAAEIDDVSLTNLIITTDGSGIDPGWFVEVFWAQNFSLTNSTFSVHANDQGPASRDIVNLNNVRTVTVDGCTFDDAGDNAIYVGDNLNPSNYVTLSNNTIDDSEGDGIDAEWTYNLGVLDNTITDSDEDGIDVDDGQHATISGNSCSLNDNDGLDIEDYDDATVSGNDFFRNDDEGLDARDCDRHTYSDNNCYENNDEGFDLNNVDDLLMSGNTAVRNDDDGLEMDNCDTVVMQDNEFSGNEDDGMDIDDCNGVLAERNVFSNNEDEGIDADDVELTLLQNWIMLNGEEGVETDDVDGADGEYVEAHGNVICDNCRDPNNVGECWIGGTFVPVQVDANDEPVNFEYNFWGGAPLPQWFEGPVDYQPWLSLGLSASSKHAANGTAFATITASLMGGPVTGDEYKVADGVPVSFGTDLGFFGDAKQDVKPDVPTVDGVATAKLYSNKAGYAKVSAWAYNDMVEKTRLVTFVPAKVKIKKPIHKSVVTDRTPMLSWTKSPSGGNIEYRVRMVKVRPRPRKNLYRVWTDATSYESPYLRGKMYVLKVQACLNGQKALCSRTTRVWFRIRAPR